MQGQNESESGRSTSSIDAVPDIATTHTQDQPTSIGAYDETLLAIIGVLDHVQGESNVSGWIRAGGLWGTNSVESSSHTKPKLSGNDAVTPGDAETAMWFDDPVNFEYWAKRGRAVAECMKIPVVHGITG